MVVRRVDNGIACRRTGYDRYGIQMLLIAIQMGQRNNWKNKKKIKSNILVINQEVSYPPGDVAGKTEQRYEKTEYDQGRKGRTRKPKHDKNIFGAATAVCGRGSIVSRGFTYVVGLVPCYPVVCRQRTKHTEINNKCSLVRNSNNWRKNWTRNTEDRNQTQGVKNNDKKIQ